MVINALATKIPQYRDGHGERRIPERSFKAGDKAPTTGVYKTVHAGQHVPAHYVTALFGDTFLPCLDCSDNVRFELALSAVHLKAHPQFKR